MRKTKIPQSRLTGLKTQHIVEGDILNRGWQPIRAELEQPYDIIVDVGIEAILHKSLNSASVKPLTGALVIVASNKFGLAPLDFRPADLNFEISKDIFSP